MRIAGGAGRGGGRSKYSFASPNQQSKEDNVFVADNNVNRNAWTQYHTEERRGEPDSITLALTPVHTGGADEAACTWLQAVQTGPSTVKVPSISCPLTPHPSPTKSEST